MTLHIALRHGLPGFALDLAFDAPPGVTALFGRSGAGKTSVVNAVAGLLTPDQGRIAVDETVLFDSAKGLNLPPHRRRIGYVFQDARLFPHLDVRQNLSYGQKLAAQSSTAPTLDRITALLGLAPLLSRRPLSLSGGEKSRVALGRALLSNPRLLALDEPLAALDDGHKAEILPYLERLRDEFRLPILYVSHAIVEVARLADTLVLIDKGRVTAAGPLAQILSDPTHAPALGLRDAGSILTAIVAAQDADGLTRLDSPAGPIWLPRVQAPPGTSLRIRIRAQDVMLATKRPEGLSALNILPATLCDIRQGEGPDVLVRLDLGGVPLLARITRRSVDALSLTPGAPVFAVMKAVTVAQENVGGGSSAMRGGDDP